MTEIQEQELPWSVIDTYFKDNPNALVQHHLNSFNDFFENGLVNIIKEKNPIRIMKQQIPDTEEFRLRADLYIGGKKGDKIYYGKPVIYDDERAHFMYPNDARLRNMTYGVTIHYEIDIDYFVTDENGNVTETQTTLPNKILLGRFPIMLMSNLCILSGMEPRVRFNMGECRNDRGGYFIIDGKEKLIVPQEKFADNMLYVRAKGNDLYSHSAEIRSVSEDASKPVRTVGVRIVAPTSKYTNNQIVVTVPNVRKPVPLFILMRALGVEADLDIIRYCLLDLDKYASYIDLFIPSIHDASKLFSQDVCLKYIATLTKGKTIPHVLDILMNYFLPHIGELNFQEKAYFVGYMVRELLMVFTGDKKPTDRDSFRFKRIELPGGLLYELFKEYYNLQQKHIFQMIDKEFFYHQGTYTANWYSLIEGNYKEYLAERIVETGFKKAFKGNWGSQEHTKRPGIVQDVKRLSFNDFISHLRKINLPLDSSAKVVAPRVLHSSQWGIIDPLDTPDGGNIGLHKHMAIAAQISSGCSSNAITTWLPRNINLQRLEECSTEYLASTTKVFVNGKWVGNTPEPKKAEEKMRNYRRLGLIPPQTSVHWHIETDSIYIYTDAGRMFRPIFYVDEKTGLPSYKRDGVFEKIATGKVSWEELITGFGKKNDKTFRLNGCKVYNDVSELYGVDDVAKLSTVMAPIEYIDTAEEETALIAMTPKELEKKNGTSGYTHLEIHPSLILGVMGNQIVFPENNQLPRDLFSCGQSKQAISLYHSNFQTRIDKMGVVLNYGQIPLVKSRYMEYINREQHPYGENLIVAIMCYGGYNVEDSILFNGGSVARGMFRTTYYNMYESYEESSKIGNSVVDSRFANVLDENVVRLKPGYDYSDLDTYGLIKENTPLDDKKVVIGKVMTDVSNPDVSIDSSVFPKKGQKGFVDKSFITEGEEGQRLAKVRIREERIPAIGDKFCSRCGQKGTCGLIIEEKDMPFNQDGIRPDIIINPHALPSRMTIGQLIETVMGKACVEYGGFGDCTAFSNKGSKEQLFGKMLSEIGFHSAGNEILYNGMTGEQLEMSIFVGPTYYMRLKHMVKDKINYRAKGPRTVLTRQTVQGRANDGGLRIGEMERDALISHGLSGFLEESMMVRGDEYYMAVCNTTGTIAIYNESKNIFLSPLADGPIAFTGTIEQGMNVDDVSRFGRSFSIVRVPYAFKLMIQELQAMNVQVRLITEKNVEQLTSLSYSNNAQLRMKLGKEADIPMIASEIKDVTSLRQKVSEEEIQQAELMPEETLMPEEEYTIPEEEERQNKKIAAKRKLAAQQKQIYETRKEDVQHSQELLTQLGLDKLEPYYGETGRVVGYTIKDQQYVPIVEETLRYRIPEEERYYQPEGKEIPYYVVKDGAKVFTYPNEWTLDDIEKYNRASEGLPIDINKPDSEKSMEERIRLIKEAKVKAKADYNPNQETVIDEDYFDEFVKGLGDFARKKGIIGGSVQQIPNETIDNNAISVIDIVNDSKNESIETLNAPAPSSSGSLLLDLSSETQDNESNSNDENNNTNDGSKKTIVL